MDDGGGVEDPAWLELGKADHGGDGPIEAASRSRRGRSL